MALDRRSKTRDRSQIAIAAGEFLAISLFGGTLVGLVILAQGLFGAV